MPSTIRRDEGSKSEHGRSGIRRHVRIDDDDDAANPWEISQNVKKGLGQMIAQAWEQHERDRVLISEFPKVLEVMNDLWLEVGRDEQRFE